MHPGKNFRRNGLSPTVKPDRRASVLQSYKCPALPQIFHFLFFFRQQPESQDFLLQSLYILSTLILYVLPLLHMSHESYDLPARGIPLNEGTVLSFLPTKNRAPLIPYFRKVSVRLNRLAPHVTEQCLRCRTDTESLLKRLRSAVCYPRYFRREPFDVVFSFCKRLSGIKPEDIRFPHLCL